MERWFKFKICDVFKHQLVIAIAERGVYLPVAIHWDGSILSLIAMHGVVKRFANILSACINAVVGLLTLGTYPMEHLVHI